MTGSGSERDAEGEDVGGGAYAGLGGVRFSPVVSAAAADAGSDGEASLSGSTEESSSSEAER